MPASREISLRHMAYASRTSAYRARISAYRARTTAYNGVPAPSGSGRGLGRIGARQWVRTADVLFLRPVPWVLGVGSKVSDWSSGISAERLSGSTRMVGVSPRQPGRRPAARSSEPGQPRRAEAVARDNGLLG